MSGSVGVGRPQPPRVLGEQGCGEVPGAGAGTSISSPEHWDTAAEGGAERCGVFHAKATRGLTLSTVTLQRRPQRAWDPSPRGQDC